jgi:hypothetical protein
MGLMTKHPNLVCLIPISFTFTGSFR